MQSSRAGERARRSKPAARQAAPTANQPPRDKLPIEAQRMRT
jgi:hypothetical protein